MVVVVMLPIVALAIEVMLLIILAETLSDAVDPNDREPDDTAIGGGGDVAMVEPTELACGS